MATRSNPERSSLRLIWDGSWLRHADTLEVLRYEFVWPKSADRRCRSAAPGQSARTSTPGSQMQVCATVAVAQADQALTYGEGEAWSGIWDR